MELSKAKALAKEVELSKAKALVKEMEAATAPDVDNSEEPIVEKRRRGRPTNAELAAKKAAQLAAAKALEIVAPSSDNSKSASEDPQKADEEEIDERPITCELYMMCIAYVDR